MTLPAGPLSVGQALLEARFQARVKTIDHPEMGPSLFTSPPFRIDGERLELARPPLFGEHTRSVLTGLLGMSPEAIADLAERKILA